MAAIRTTTGKQRILRRLSLALAAAAFVAPPLWAYLETSRTIEAIQAERGLVCGMPILAIYLIAILASGLLSLGSLASGIPAYLGTTKPRPKLRLVELAVGGLPFILAGVMVLWLYVTGA